MGKRGPGPVKIIAFPAAVTPVLTGTIAPSQQLTPSDGDCCGRPGLLPTTVVPSPQSVSLFDPLDPCAYVPRQDLTEKEAWHCGVPLQVFEKKLTRPHEIPDEFRPLLMDKSLVEAAASGNATVVKQLALNDPDVLLGTTPRGNTCLHIASIFGHLGLCEEVVALNPSLLSKINADGETPLLTATASGHATSASFLLKCCFDLKLSDEILKQDKQGCNALHHAIRSGHRELALDLIAAEPTLSQALNKYNESPMFIAVMRNYADIFEKLLEITDSADAGAFGRNALYAAVRNSNSAIAKRIVETRPWLAREEDMEKTTPMHLTASRDQIDVLNVLLNHDRSLGYVINTDGAPLLVWAAARGHIGVAQELLKYCPDAPYCRADGWTCLHEAVQAGQDDFLEFVLDESQHHELRKLINMRSSDGKTALHYAVEKCNPRMVRALLRHKEQDVRVYDNLGIPAYWAAVSTGSIHAKTLNWNEVSMLMLKADAAAKPTNAYNRIRKAVKNQVTERSRANIKSLTDTYITNTSLVAILIATITFAAAFTLPGGYSEDAANKGLPIMGRKLAFQAFLVADTLAMCSSLSVAFICIIARWEDLEFLLYYRSFTKKLMWFAYMATTTAFATGLYTVLAPRLLWLAIAVCVLSALMPLFTKLLGEWPMLKLRYRLGRTFKSEFLDIV